MNKITVIYCQINIIFKSPALYKVKAVDDSFHIPLEAAPHDPHKIKAQSARGSTRSHESIFIFFDWDKYYPFLDITLFKIDEKNISAKYSTI